MTYLVTTQQRLFDGEDYKVISLEESLTLVGPWKIIQVDSETSGRDPHLCDFLCVQLGNDAADARVVIDTSTIDIRRYKDILERSLCILQNAKFDLQFFYNYGIIIRHVYDTMIVEQLLHLGWPKGSISYALNAISERRLGVYIDKSVRGEIIWRGLDNTVIRYAAGDVTPLEKIMWSQVEDLKKQGLVKAAQVECNFVPTIAYLEWCGIHLDANKWIAKMLDDKNKLEESEEALNKFVTDNPDYKEFTYVNPQGDLFEGFDLTPKCTIQWSSAQQVTKFAKLLGFDTSVQDKETGEDKDSVMEKHLKMQKGVNDKFIELYFNYREHFKATSSFGQGHLNAINTKTDRIHTIYRQLGTASGRMSCGSQQQNTELAKYKGISPKGCTYPNIQQLPADESTRSSFTAPEGYEWCSCDYSA